MGDVFNVNDTEHASMNYVRSSLGDNEWFVDYASIYHMSPYQHHFSNYSPFKNCFILWLIMWNVQKCAISRIGNARLKISRYELVSKNVRHVCDLNHNLISCAVLEDEDFRVNAKTAWWRLWMIYIVLLFWKQLE